MDVAAWFTASVPYVESLLRNEMFYYSIAFILLLWLIMFVSRTNRPKIMDVYSQPGKYFYLKFKLILMMLRYRGTKRSLQCLVGGKQLKEARKAELERPQPLDPMHPHVRRIFK